MSGFYAPEDIAAESKRFAEASEQAGTVFEDRQRDAKLLNAALRQYEVALDVLGDRAPAAERARLAGLWKEYSRQFAVLDAFATTMMDDFDTEFKAAMARSLKKYPTAVECQREIASGPRMMGISGRTQANPACKGDDLNGKIARDMDADAILAKAVAEIGTLRWPEVALKAEPQAPIGVGERSVNSALFALELLPNRLAAISRADRDAREPFEVKIEEGATTEELAALKAEAEAVTKKTSAARAAAAAPVLAAADKQLAKWTKKGAPATAWCANPADLGGCTVPDATKELIPSLQQAPKVAKAASKADAT